MSDPVQMQLKFPEASLAKQEWPKLLELVRRSADAHERKEVGVELDLSRSVLDNILMDRDRHALKAKHLLYFLLIDESGQILKMLAALTGHQVSPKKPLTPTQKAQAYERVIRKRLGDFGEELLRSALLEVE